MRSIASIRKKYGAEAFKKWGKLGGSPILKAYEEGRVTIHAKRRAKKAK